MNLLYSIVIGIVAGWIAGLLVKGGGFGLIGDLIVGVIGAVLGGWLFGIFGLTAYGTMGFLIMSVVGAVVFLFIVKIIKRA